MITASPVSACELAGNAPSIGEQVRESLDVASVGDSCHRAGLLDAEPAACFG